MHSVFRASVLAVINGACAGQFFKTNAADIIIYNIKKKSVPGDEFPVRFFGNSKKYIKTSNFPEFGVDKEIGW